MFSSNFTLLRLLAWLEGISFILILAVGMPLKYLYQISAPNLYIGMVHGILFLAYCGLVIMVRQEKNWGLATTFWAILAACLPFGTFVADAKIFKSSQ